MKELSYWAKANPWRARFIIILLHIVLVVAAVFVGSSLRIMEMKIPVVFNWLAMALFLIAAVYYPAKRGKWTSRLISHYLYQKSCDFILTFTGLFMICFLCNQSSNLRFGLNALHGAFPPGAPAHIKANKSGDKPFATYVLSKKERKTMRSALRSELRTFFKSKSGAGKAGLVVLTVLGAIVLLLLVSSLACNLSCSGNEGAATFVLIFGFAAVIALTVLVIRKINQRRPPQKSLHEERRGMPIKA